MATLQQFEQLLFEVDRLLTWMEYSLHGAIMNDNLSWQYYGVRNSQKSGYSEPFRPRFPSTTK